MANPFPLTLSPMAYGRRGYVFLSPFPNDGMTIKKSR